MADSQPLHQALELSLYEATQEAHRYTSKLTLLHRIFVQCAEALQVEVHMPQTLRIHPDNRLILDTVWHSLGRLSHDEENVYKLVKSSECVHLVDLQKFLTLLTHKHQTAVLNELLALDGFDSNLKAYVDHLTLGREGSTHIHALRTLYRAFPGCPVKVIHCMLLTLFIRFTQDDELKQLVVNTLRDLESDPQVRAFGEWDAMTRLYVQKVDHLETVALLKMTQLKLQKKKNKKHAH